MPWIQVSLTVPEPEGERYSEALLNSGALSVTFVDAEDQPVFEPLPGETPLWQHTRVTGLFEADADVAEIQLNMLVELGGEDSLKGLSYDILEDQVWERAWLEHFKPMCFGERLWVVPRGQETPDAAEAVCLILDPGLAFGTGTHPTTDLCLQRLDRMDLRGKTVLDYGCGSGILGIAALLLGAKEAWMIDIDPQALAATQSNAELNGVADKIRTGLPDELEIPACDVVLANILAGPLQSLAPTLSGFAAEQAELSLSGILAEQAAAVSQAYADMGFCMQPPACKEEWVRIDGNREHPAT